jgi:eukaryotic-like serine/threonine-protein kinase
MLGPAASNLTDFLLLGPTTTATSRVIAGRYTVERELGRGATATVYLCRDNRTNGPVAIKVLRPELAESVGAERFLREIRLTAELHHPHILAVLDSGAEDGLLYFVLPHMDGGTLRDRLMRDKQFPIGDAVGVIRTVTEALGYAHSRGLIHRDIKPENILFSGGEAYLGDFGIARLLNTLGGETTTTTGVVRGTPMYMSPEQASGERNLDARSDIYSLACVFYEMVSGMPPFIGPTSQSVMAQRFTNQPRPMRVYRDTVSPELEQVVERAMMSSPADRYPTAAEFGTALEAAGRTVTGRTITHGSPTGLREQRGVALAAVVLLLVGMAGWAMRDRFASPSVAVAQPTDTTQLALLPFDATGSGAPASQSFDAQLYDAFSGWQGISVVEPFRVRDAVLRNHKGSGPVDSRTVALALGVGRYVRGDLVAVGDSLLVQAGLYDAESGTTLSHTSVRIGKAAADRGETYERLAKELLVRGRPDSVLGSRLPPTRSLPATQSFARAFDALDEWNLARADSLFQNAIRYDPGFARAYLWVAQVRVWQGDGVFASAMWLPLLAHALEGRARLSAREEQIATALSALGNGDFDTACMIYDRLARQNASDFAAWYGSAQCRTLDFRVVPDTTSPTRWRYAASYQQAVNAYQKAFQVLSLSRRGVEQGAYEPLRRLLFMFPSQLQTAKPKDTTVKLVGRLDTQGDSLVMRPVSLALVMSGDPVAVPKGLKAALDRQKQLFQEIAGAWSAALPRSAGAKEAVAVAMEMRGDRSSVDTLRVARLLSTDPQQQLRLAVAEVIGRVRVADQDRSGELATVKALADSVLAARLRPTSEEAELLAPLAALTGRCRLTSSLVTLSSRVQNAAGKALPLPRDIIADANALGALTTLGCDRGAVSSVAQIRKRVAAIGGRVSSIDEYSVVAPAVRAADPLDSTQVASFATLNGDYLLRAELAMLRRQPDTVRTLLNRVEAARAVTGADGLSADAVYLEARVLLAIGDTASAVTRLDRMFDRIDFSTPGMLGKAAPMAAYVRSMALRADVALARRESAVAARWASAVVALWSGADADLAPTVKRMSNISGRH